MVLPVLVILVFLPDAGTRTLWMVGLGLLVFAAIGLVDDIMTLPILPRLLAQGLAGLVVALAIDHANPITALLGLLLLVATVNAFNFMDGINGISGATMVVAGGAYLLMGVHSDVTEVAVLGAASAGVGVGFLPYNFPIARVFLGDVGSYFCGGLLAFTAILAISEGIPAIASLAPLGLYGFDTSLTLFRRARRGERLGEAHREHVYQQLAGVVGHGLPTSIVAFGSALTASVGALSLSDSELLPLQLVLFALIALAYAFVPRFFGQGDPS